MALDLTAPSYSADAATPTMIYDNIVHPLLLQVDQYMGLLLIVGGLFLAVSIMYSFFFGLHRG